MPVHLTGIVLEFGEGFVPVVVHQAVLALSPLGLGELRWGGPGQLSLLAVTLNFLGF